MQIAEFVLTPSKKLAYFLHTVYLLTLFVIATLDINTDINIGIGLPLIWKTLASLLLIWFWNKDYSTYCSRDVSTDKNQIVKIWHKQGKQFGFQTPSKSYSGLLKGDSYKCPWFIILRLKSGSRVGPRVPLQSPRTRTVFIAKDSLSPQEYALLSARLLSF